MQKNKDLKDSEAIGNIKSMPAEPAVVLDNGPLPEPVIDNPQDFQMAIGNAQMDGLEYLEVSDRLFTHLTKGRKTDFITYGDPGVKVYRAGTREKFEDLGEMKAEDYANHLGKNKGIA